MHKEFLSYIQSEKLFTAKDSILVAVSGGMDSITLCELLRINKFNFSIAHFNHVTRNGESDLDEIFVKKYAKKYSIPFFSTRVDINKIIEKDTGGNFQNLARIHRYKWLEIIKAENNFDFIATAHHHNDQIETFLFHFSRGTGLDGLTGIDAKQGHLVRPLLRFKRVEIESFVFENKIDYRIDSSNTNSKYSRNYIRHGIIPSLKILNPNFENNAATTIDNLRSASSLYQFLLKQYLSPYIRYMDKGIIHINTAVFKHSRENNKQLSFELLRQYGFNYSQSSQIQSSLDQRGNLFYTENYVLLIEQNALLIKKHSKAKKVFREIHKTTTVPGYGKLSISIHEPLEIYPSTPTVEYVDADKIFLPLLLRNKVDGDKFKPLGMKGKTKKLKDYFTDLKLNKFQKEEVLVLLSKNQVVWVIGYRISDRFKITPKTKRILKMEWEPA